MSAAVAEITLEDTFRFVSGAVFRGCDSDSTGLQS